MQTLKKKKKYSSSEMYKTWHHNESYLLLLEKRKLQSLDISHEYFPLLWNKHLLF